MNIKGIKPIQKQVDLGQEKGLLVYHGPLPQTQYNPSD
jgi:hypothetical protein